MRLKASPSEAAAAGSSRALLDLFRLSRAVRADKLDAFLFPSLYTYFPVLGTPTVVGLHDTIDESTSGSDGSIPARAWRCPAEGVGRRPAREPALHGLPGLAEGDRGALRDPGGAADARVRGTRSGLFPAERRPARRGPRQSGPDRRRSLLPLCRRDQPAQERRAVGRRLCAWRSTGVEPRRLSSCWSETSRARAYSRRRRRCGAGSRATDLQTPSAFPASCRRGARSLYAARLAVVIPSLAEGFGLPAVEAAACGAAVALSDLPPHHERLGDAALFFPPTDVGAARGRISRCLARTSRCERVAARAATRSPA